MEGIKFFLILITVAVFDLASYANAETLVKNAAQHQQWLSLLHFQKPLLGRPESAVEASNFFYSESGRFDPQAELSSTILAFENSPQEQCRFPARALFITKFIRPLPDAECEQFKSFITNIDASSVSLIYASGYLGNPASMYGHVFLKFNNKEQSELLDNTYNYGARYPDNEHPIAYILNGIFGGYDGYFANQKYHHQTLNYTENELRDLWEYTLAFSTDDITFLLAHLWELEQVPMTYYFFKQNCAYQIAELLSLITGKSYIPAGKPWVMPFDIVTEIKNNDPNFIKSVKYHPSRQEALYSRYKQLTRKERDIFIQALTSDKLDSASLEQTIAPLNEHQKKRVVDTAFDYFSYLTQSQKNENENNLKKQKEIFVDARFKLPPGKSQFVSITPDPPHDAQNTTLLQLGINRDNSGTSARFRFRANYYDLLTKNPGRIPFSELSTFDIRVDINQNGKINVSELTALRIANLNASNTGLPSDNRHAWKLAIGYRELIAGKPEGSLYIDSFIGKGYSPAENVAIYGGLSATATAKNNLGGYVAVGLEIGGVTHVSPHYAMSLNLGHQKYINALNQKRTYATWEQRFFNHKNYDLRALIRYDGDVEYSISLSHYF